MSQQNTTPVAAAVYNAALESLPRNYFAPLIAGDRVAARRVINERWTTASTPASCSSTSSGRRWNCSSRSTAKTASASAA